VNDLWRYTETAPAEGWQALDYDDSAWQEGYGGFGAGKGREFRTDTSWSSSDIWLRKVIELNDVPERPALYLNHNEDVEIYLNGHQVAAIQGVTRGYELLALDEDAAQALRAGRNVLAVHCNNERGTQFVDVHLAAGGAVPELPKPRRLLYPFKTELTTPWTESVTAETAWAEYPRPQLMREYWLNLNGLWDYAITPATQTNKPETWAGQILVPFALESRLSGVQQLLQPDQALWYRRTVDLHAKPEARMLLNFEAVDYRCEIWVNGTKAGSHRGGNTPFSLDITGAVQDGANEILVRVEDETEAWQLRGKQVLEPHGIWYTRVSGIWQTVWLEEVPQSYIEDLHISTDAETGSITVAVDVGGAQQLDLLQVTVKDGDEILTAVVGPASGVTTTIVNAKLWTPDTPFLYGLEIALIDAKGDLADRAVSYAGIRTVGRTRDSEGHLRFTINGNTIFHWGPLDQGWWPDGLLTPPSDEGMLYDIQFLKAAGFNMIRKHIKVEPRRYYYHCDRLGMMVWQDQPSGGINPPWTFLGDNPQDADWPGDQHWQYLVELDRMIDNLENHPSIVVWVPFNEAWGQHRSVEVGQWTQKRDPSRLVNIASGGNFFPVGDIADMHAYPEPAFLFDADRFGEYIKVVGEFGGHGFPVQEHLWNPTERNWGYGELPKTEDEYKARFRNSIQKLQELRTQGVAGGVYTQTTDVEVEINGLLTYDRRVAKLPAAELATIQRECLPVLMDSGR
jgi:beta-galactosidase